MCIPCIIQLGPLQKLLTNLEIRGSLKSEISAIAGHQMDHS